MRQHLSYAEKAALYESIFENSQDGLIIVNSHQQILQWNEVAKKICFVNDTDQADVRISGLFTHYDFQRDFQTYESRVVRNNTIEVAIFQYPIDRHEPTAEKIVIIKNITEYKHTERTLLAERARMQVTLQCVDEAVIVTDINDDIEYLNPVAERYTGWSDSEAQGLPLPDVFALVEPMTHAPLADPVRRCLQAGQKVQSPDYSLFIQRDGQERAVTFTATPMRHSAGGEAPGDGPIVGAVLVFRDVTHMIDMARQIEHQAAHDALTGLINRHAFEECLIQALESAKEEESQHVLCYLDLDQFKIVNDTCGHAAGDELLRQLATLLRSHIRYTDILSRLGGDEFGLILRHCPMDEARQVVEKLRHTIRDFRFVWEDKTLEIGVSIGVVPIAAGCSDLVTIMRAADSACTLAKEQGRNHIQIYQSDDKVMAQRHGEMQWVHRISRALAEERFCLYFQRIMPLTPAVGQVHGEVLLRMVDEQGQLVPPAAFIPAAERYKLMPAIDRWVIRTAIAIMAQKLRGVAGGTSCMGISINLSGQSLCDEQLLEFITEQFQQSGVEAERVCFEITETAVIANLSQAIQLMLALRDLGCHFALDDFGSGLSSFAYLKQLPVDYLKIDGSFVRGMLEDPIDHAIVDSINQIGHVMGIQTIAEFVENTAMVSQLRALGVDYAQGYGVARPEPLLQ
jgi:diguanylate cyclase (GGDEF)-like protein/PAS domain S-box-containing protein